MRPSVACMFSEQPYLSSTCRRRVLSVHKISSGVPQGGLLSPILFVIYTSELASAIFKLDAYAARTYADDIQVHKVIEKTSDIETLQGAMDYVCQKLVFSLETAALPRKKLRRKVLRIGNCKLGV